MIFLKEVLLLCKNFSDFLFFFKFSKYLRNHTNITILSSPFHFKVFKKNLVSSSFFLKLGFGVFLKKKKIFFFNTNYSQYIFISFKVFRLLS